MRILIISQWFDPEPTFKGLAFAKELVRLGHRVEVLTGFPNYPGGKLYPGYRLRLFQRETIDGVSVLRVPLFPSHDASGAKRAANYLSFALSAALFGPILAGKADVAYVYHPPATVALPALAFKLLRGVPFVYDIQDLWPDTLAATGMLTNRTMLRCIDAACRLTYRAADHLVVLSPGFRRLLQERGVPGEKISLVYNWCDEEKVGSMERREAARREPELSGRFNVVFAGNMGKAQALGAVLEAAALLSGKLPQVRFVFVGGGVEVERLKEKQREMELNNVLFLPRRPMAQIGSLLSLADVLLVHLKDDPLFAITLPSKTQAYLAAGRPILMAVRGDAAALVEEAGAGMACTPEDPESIALTVEKLAALKEEERDAMGAKGLRYYRQELALPVGARRFAALFESLAASSTT